MQWQGQCGKSFVENTTQINGKHLCEDSYCIWTLLKHTLMYWSINATSAQIGQGEQDFKLQRLDVVVVFAVGCGFRLNPSRCCWCMFLFFCCYRWLPLCCYWATYTPNNTTPTNRGLRHDIRNHCSAGIESNCVILIRTWETSKWGQVSIVVCGCFEKWRCGKFSQIPNGSASSTQMSSIG